MLATTYKGGGGDLPGVGDQDLVLGVAGHVPGIVELPVARPLLTKLVYEHACRVQHKLKT